MATKKKDLLNQDTTGVDIPETIEGTVSGNLSAELPAVIQTNEGTGDTALDLNELLSSMDQQSETEDGGMMEDSTSAGFTTEETDGESLSSENVMTNAAESTTASEKERAGELSSADLPGLESGEAPTVETETPKPKRTSRKKDTRATAYENHLTPRTLKA